MREKDVLDELDEEVHKVCVEPHCSGPLAEDDGIIYHYTNASGLIGIVKSGKLWATSLHCLNDPRETEYGLEMSRLHLGALMNEPGNHQEIVNTAVKTLDTQVEILYPKGQVAASLSQDGDLLSQWRAYSDAGKGFAIGFCCRDLRRILIERYENPNSDKIPRYAPFKCIYEESLQRKQLSRVTELVFGYQEKLQRTAEDNVDTKLGVLLSWWLAFASMPFKAPGFAEEKEVRLSIANIMNVVLAKTFLSVKVRDRDGQLVTYHEIDLRNEGGLLPLRRITLGPTLDRRDAEVGLKQFLETYGYLEALGLMPEIAQSSTALRR